MSDSDGTIIIQEATGLGSFTIGDLGVFIGTLGGVITSILIVLQKSHCKKIKFCCWECERDIGAIEDEEKGNKPVAKGEVGKANEERERLQEASRTLKVAQEELFPKAGSRPTSPQPAPEPEPAPPQK